MQILFSNPFKKDYERLPKNVQKALDKALRFLLTNPRHPALRAKKLPGVEIWYARVSRGYRFTFEIRSDFIILRRAGTHAILNKERR